MNAGAAIKKPQKKEGGRSTKVMRVPLEIVEQVETYTKNKGYRIPFLSGKIPAGFPLNAENHVEEWVDLNQMVIKHPESTFMIEAMGDSMIGAGIQEKDLLIVDGSIEAKSGMIVIAAIDGEYTVKRFHNKDGKIKLLPANKEYPEIDITDKMQFYIAGVVIEMVRKFLR